MKRVGDPNGSRTRVTAVKGRCPRPLDDRVTKPPNIPFVSAKATPRILSAQASDLQATGPRGRLRRDVHPKLSERSAPFLRGHRDLPGDWTWFAAVRSQS